MVSEMGGRIRGSYGNLPHNYNSRTTSFGSNRAISLDHYGNHRRMSDVIQTVTSDSTVYYHQRLNEQDALSRAAKQNSIQGPTTDNVMPRTVHQDAEENDEASRVQSNNNCSLPSKNVKPKLSSSVSCTSNSPKSIISRLRQLTGRLSFSFDKEPRRMSGGTQTQIIKTSASKNNNTTSVCCNDETRNRACSLDVPASKFNSSSGASSNNGSHRSLSSNKNDDADESSKKVPGEGDTAEIWQNSAPAVTTFATDEVDMQLTSLTQRFRSVVLCKCCERKQQVRTAHV